MKKREKFISQCCLCRKVRRKDGFKFTGDKHKHMDEWDHHHEDLKEIHNEFDVIFSHGFCDDCGEKVMKEFEEEIK